MPGRVIALLSDKRSAPLVLDAAERLACLSGGSEVDALVIRLDAHGAALIVNDNVEELSLSRIQESEETIHKQEVERSCALRLQFDDWVRSNKSRSVSLIDREGKCEIVFDSLRDKLDYVVVARPDASSCLAEHEALFAAVFASGRPVLVMPPKARVDFGRIIAIAWQDDQDTLQIAMNAMRLFTDAKEIHFLIGCRAGSLVPNVPQYEVNHPATIAQHIVPIDQNDRLGEVILATAGSLNVDLLVAGATSHNTWHILLFGEVTKVLLHQTGLPLLLYRTEHASGL